MNDEFDRVADVMRRSRQLPTKTDRPDDDFSLALDDEKLADVKPSMTTSASDTQQEDDLTLATNDGPANGYELAPDPEPRVVLPFADPYPDLWLLLGCGKVDSLDTLFDDDDVEQRGKKPFQRPLRRIGSRRSRCPQQSAPTGESVDRDAAITEMFKTATYVEDAGFPIEGRLIRRAARTAKAVNVYALKLGGNVATYRIVLRALEMILADCRVAIAALRVNGSGALGKWATAMADILESELRSATTYPGDLFADVSRALNIT